MAHYFNPSPIIEYKLPGISPLMIVNNITARFKISAVLKTFGAIYYDYEVKDDERPDIIASKYYDDETLDWVVLLVNEIHDPYYQWVMSYRKFQAYIIQKYGSIASAQGTIRHYEKTIQERSIDELTGETVVKRTLIVDSTTYSATPSNMRRQVDCYTYEDELNESRRNIKILDVKYIDIIIDAHRTIFK